MIANELFRGPGAGGRRNSGGEVFADVDPNW